jgi:hypothetical protein
MFDNILLNAEMAGADWMASGICPAVDVQTPSLWLGFLGTAPKLCRESLSIANYWGTL